MPMTDTHVVAEEAPLGVQLWPTLDDERYGLNFTLSEVQVVRTETRRFVRWVYCNGKTREFDLGERVVVRIQD